MFQETSTFGKAMPSSLHGDIFKEITHKAYDLAVIFGHIGFNEMSLSWREFRGLYSNLADVPDPFTMFGGQPVLIGNAQWIWFVPEEHNHGLTDQRLSEILSEVVKWCRSNNICSVITNGIADIDHTGVTAENRMSDDRRARYLRDYLCKHEGDGLNFTLISLNDVFVR